MVFRVDAYLGDGQKQVRTVFGDDPLNPLLMAVHNLDARLLHTVFGFKSIRNGTCTCCFHVENADLLVTSSCCTNLILLNFSSGVAIQATHILEEWGSIWTLKIFAE